MKISSLRRWRVKNKEKKLIQKEQGNNLKNKHTTLKR